MDDRKRRNQDDLEIDEQLTEDGGGVAELPDADDDLIDDDLDE